MVWFTKGITYLALNTLPVVVVQIATHHSEQIPQIVVDFFLTTASTSTPRL